MNCLLKFLYIVIFFYGNINLLFPQDTISLQGKWQIALDGNYKDWPRKIGEELEWYKSELPTNNSIKLFNDLYFKNAEYSINDWITLPGSTDEAQIGVPLIESQAFTIGLERKFSYDGAFWVQRKITIPDSWQGKLVYYTMERLLGSSKVFWDGKFIGEDYGLAYPHKFLVDTAIVSGTHTITVLINKDDSRYQQYGHHVVNGNGISWNGIVGKIELVAYNRTCHINQIQIYPNISTKSIDVKLNLNGNKNSIKKIISFFLRKKGEGKFTLIKNLEILSNNLETNIKIPEPIDLWNEFTPNLYELRTEIKTDTELVDSKTIIFGVREIGTNNGNITINGNKIFIRGSLDNGVSPLKGYPDMSKKEWLDKLNVFKSFGINLIRFHTWCPPEAAFAAADELGLYLQAELSGSPYAELDRILETYGNHVSFCMLSLNNEAFSHNEITQKIIRDAKIKDNRHLYTCTTHPVKPDCIDDFYISAWGNKPINDWPNYDKIVGITWGGGDNITASRFNTNQPETKSDYSQDLVGINAPIISHEAGQWVMFPNFNGIDKYKGVLRNTNYERIKKLFEKNHPLNISNEFALASGKFSAILYKEEIESALRTPNFGGFELLGLRDYQGQWTAIVGILDAFTESKGIVTPNEHSMYCNAIVPLARMEKRVFTNDEILTAEVDVANYSLNDLINQTAIWQLLDKDGNAVNKGKLKEKNILKGQLTRFNNISIPLMNIIEPSKLILKISLPGKGIENTWNIWVYPKQKKIDEGSIKILSGSQIDELEKYLLQNEKVLLLLDKEDLKNARESCFATIFWNSLFKWPQKSHTLGIYCNPEHPAFSKFPTENHSDWQWWDIAMNANAVNLNSFPKDYEPIINVIDSYHLNNKLSYLFECKIGEGKLLVSTIDLINNLEKRPASNQLKKSILDYMNSDLFNPQQKLNIDLIYSLVKN